MSVNVKNAFFLKRTILGVALLTTIFLSTWQDFFLSTSLGEIFKSPVVLLCPFFLISEYYLKNVRGGFFGKINNIYIYFHLLYIFVTVIYLGIWITNNNGMSFLGENIFLKSIKQILYYSFFWGLFRYFYLLLKKADNYNIKVDHVFLFILIGYVFIMLWEAKFMPNALTLFHIDKSYTRIRLLTSESSGTGSIAIMLLAGLCMGKRSTIKLITSVLFSIIFVAISGSKMFLVGAGIAVIILNLKLIKTHKTTSILGLVVFLAVFYLFIFPYLYNSFTSDIENATSVTTRSLFYISSLRSLYLFPIGTGGLSSVYFLRTFDSSTKLLANTFPDLNFTEALSLGTINGIKGVAAGSTFGNFAVLLGIPGMWLLVKLLRILTKAAKSNIMLSFFMIYFIITNLTSESMENKFTYAIFFAVIAYLADKNLEKQSLKTNENISSIA